MLATRSGKEKGCGHPPIAVSKRPEEDVPEAMQVARIVHASTARSSVKECAVGAPLHNSCNLAVRIVRTTVGLLLTVATLWIGARSTSYFGLILSAGVGLVQGVLHALLKPRLLVPKSSEGNWIGIMFTHAVVGLAFLGLCALLELFWIAAFNSRAFGTGSIAIHFGLFALGSSIGLGLTKVARIRGSR
ncbi:MAG: hypothetical protein HONBIEJF_00272 [Fimbriimonadaceae bacterium]|nr:hypothetical protein [Fimbriimonadaceae bacterium]